MRKNTARHWLHAGLDLLPLILIPVFMIYSHRHTIDSGSIEVPVNKVVDFNQLVRNGNFVNVNDWYSVNGTIETGDSKCVYTVTTGQGFFDNSVRQNYTFNYDFIDGHKVYMRCYIKTSESLICGLAISGATIYETCSANVDTLIDGIATTFVDYPIQIGIESPVPQVGTTMTIYDFNIFDLTLMFGAGNEPTVEQFNQWYTNDYYDYTLSSKQLLKGYSTQTYNDTDIMSQFTYQLYNSVDKYFNMGNVFGMSNVYDWFNLNIFGGNASISIYIVWNIVLYEFVMDLIFLLYALFMWFIDVTKRLIEKPLDSIK